MSDEELNRSLALFVCKVREANGSKYPPNTLHGVFIYYTLFYSRLYFSRSSLEPGALKCPKSTCWYSNMPVGHNKLASAVKRLCEQTGISGYRTNHLLPATVATRMHDMGIDEQLICEKTIERTEVIER